MAQITFRLEDETRGALEAAAERRGVGVSTLMAMIAEQFADAERDALTLESLSRIAAKREYLTDDPAEWYPAVDEYLREHGEK